MTKAQALKLAKAKLGKTAWVRYNRAGLSKAQREAAGEALREHYTVKRPGTEGYPEWRKLRDTLLGRIYAHRYEVGDLFETPFGVGARIAGGGDTWEEALKAAGVLPRD